MPEAARTRSPTPNGGWPFGPLPFLSSQPLRSGDMTGQPLGSGLMAMDVFESWLDASRQMMDIWRTSTRTVQDIVLESCRKQMLGQTGYDIQTSQERPAQTPERRTPLARTAVARNNLA